MKKYILALSLLMVNTFVLAQQNAPIYKDGYFAFDKKIIDAEDKWVIFPKNANSNVYPYGIIYMDEVAGFTFDLQGLFSINSNGKYITDTTFAAKNKYGRYKIRLDNSAKRVSLLDPAHYSDLNIVEHPEWLKGYKSTYVDDASHNFQLGFIYNGAGDSEKALTYLNKAEKEDPLYKGLAFEMIFAYNALNRFSEAEKAAMKAIKENQTNLLLYRELGYAYLGENNLPKAIEAMKMGIDNCPTAVSNDKAEIAFNLAKAYNASGNIAEYKKWAAKAKEWTNPNGSLYKYLVSIGF